MDTISIQTYITSFILIALVVYIMLVIAILKTLFVSPIFVLEFNFLMQFIPLV